MHEALDSIPSASKEIIKYCPNMVKVFMTYFTLFPEHLSMKSCADFTL
jgi:hypothetical protein